MAAIILPIRTTINKFIRKSNFNDISESYIQLLTKFQSDYERFNPITKREGKIRKYKQLIKETTDVEEKKAIEEKLQRVQNIGLNFRKNLNRPS